jgi:hypothetical protein
VRQAWRRQFRRALIQFWRSRQRTVANTLPGYDGTSRDGGIHDDSVHNDNGNYRNPHLITA